VGYSSIEIRNSNKAQTFGKCEKVECYTPDWSGNPFCFFSKTKRLERKAGKWLEKCPSVLVQNFINGCWWAADYL
jgi:hypothetical protein